MLKVKLERKLISAERKILLLESSIKVHEADELIKESL